MAAIKSRKRTTTKLNMPLIWCKLSKGARGMDGMSFIRSWYRSSDNAQVSRGQSASRRDSGNVWIAVIKMLTKAQKGVKSPLFCHTAPLNTTTSVACQQEGGGGGSSGCWAVFGGNTIMSFVNATTANVARVWIFVHISIRIWGIHNYIQSHRIQCIWQDVEIRKKVIYTR